jgi:hypothetical protein
VQERDDEEREEDCEEGREPLVEQLGEHLLAQCADRQRGQRDPELHRRDEMRWVAGDLHHGASRATALVGELLHPRPAHGDERVLARDEERVQQDEGSDCQ